MPAGPGGPIAWLDATTLLFAFLPPGVSAQESILYWKRGIGDARRAWEKGAAGTEHTASVIESGGAAREVPSIFLARFDAVRRVSTTLAEIPRWDLWDLALSTQIAISPDRKRAAFLAVTGTIGLRPEAPVTEAIRTYRAGIVPLESLASRPSGSRSIRRGSTSRETSAAGPPTAARSRSPSTPSRARRAGAESCSACRRRKARRAT